ncbi:MAG: NUDIX hydrolase [Candidatus Aenigmarchaeota archaeon]|nr:NUDIX hydrolase [Candidatus Aenigmarchaeota archaeon]
MKILSKKDFNIVFSKTARVTVDLVIKDERGVLLIKRDIYPDIGTWHLPGGTVHYKEKILDAVKRKAKEETGLQVKIEKFLGVCEHMKWRSPGYSHIIDLVFLCKPLKGKLKGDSRYGGEELKFFKKIPKNLMSVQKAIFQGKLLK